MPVRSLTPEASSIDEVDCQTLRALTVEEVMYVAMVVAQISFVLCRSVLACGSDRGGHSRAGGAQHATTPAAAPAFLGLQL